MMKGLLPEIWKNRSQILEGIKNRIFKKEHIEELAKARLEICKGCSWYTENNRENAYEDLPEIMKKVRDKESYMNLMNSWEPRCLNCGCVMETKVRCLSCNCPIMKWTQVVNNLEENEIKEIANKK